MPPSERPSPTRRVHAVVSACAANPSDGRSLGGVCSAWAVSLTAHDYRPTGQGARRRDKRTTTGSQLNRTNSGIARRGLNRSRRAPSAQRQSPVSLAHSSPYPPMVEAPGTSAGASPFSLDVRAWAMSQVGGAPDRRLISPAGPSSTSVKGASIRRFSGGNAVCMSTRLVCCWPVSAAVWAPANTTTPGCAPRHCLRWGNGTC